MTDVHEQAQQQRLRFAGMVDGLPLMFGAARGDGFVEIRAGLRAGERVVTAANFLIDAESNLKAALASLAAPPAADGEGDT